MIGGQARPDGQRMNGRHARVFIRMSDAQGSATVVNKSDDASRHSTIAGCAHEL